MGRTVCSFLLTICTSPWFAALLIAVALTVFPAMTHAEPPKDDNAATMADVATPEEMQAFLAANKGAELLIFTGDRARPVRRDDALPRLYLQRSATERSAFQGSAQPGEFYTFQITLLNTTDAPIGIIESKLELPGVPEGKLHCLNFETRPQDEPPLRDGLPIAPHSLKTLWMAVEAPSTPGDRTGAVKIACHNRISGKFQTLSVPVTIQVAGAPVRDGGVDEAWRLARLKWLLPGNLGNTPEPTRGFDPIQRSGRTLKLTGKTLRLAETGLPEQIESLFSGSNTRIGKQARPMLKAPVRFVVETDSGPVVLQPEGSVRFVSEGKDGVSWVALNKAGDLRLECRGRLEFDGLLQYQLRLSATHTIDVRDIRLEVPYRADTAAYLMGLGVRGGKRPTSVDWKWDTEKHQDRVWIGDVNIGAQWQFKGANYRRPLVNIYYGFRPLALPESWGNGGKGGVQVSGEGADMVLLKAYSGARRVNVGETLHFDAEILLTPSRPIATDKQWAVRYYHPGDSVDTGLGEKYLAYMKESGANVLNIHHRQRLNPFINYPFNDFSVPELTDFIKRAHAENYRVKVYYTTRELTQNMPEFFALHRFDGAVIQPGPGPLSRTLIHGNGPNPWLNENLRINFIPAWYTELDGKYAGQKDLSVLTTPDGPWNNFYLGGLDWIAEHAGIDGIYIDDTALDRQTMLRARRILEARRPDPLVDFHSWNPFSHEDSYIVSASLYMDLFPFVDRLWLGEAADYNQSADAWLVQYAGIPYGVMSEMLEGGGNPWRGMVFGMTGRLPWAGDPRPLWKFWDSFGMSGSEMIGWWDPVCPVRTDRDDVKVTVYRKKGKTLLAIASWAAAPVAITLKMDGPSQTLEAPEIANFQKAAHFAPGEPITIQPGKGLLLLLEK